MAQDALKVADHVGWEKFHLMGASMGMSLLLLHISLFDINDIKDI